VLIFEVTNILMRHKYVEAPYAFHIIYGLCVTFILALFEGQTFLTSRRFTTVSFGKYGIFATFEKCYFTTVSLGNSLPRPYLFNLQSILYF